MHLFLASDNGNPVAVLVGLPVLLVSLVAALVCFSERWRAALIFFGVVCILAAGLLYLTLGESVKDRTLTAVVAGALFVTGVTFLASKRKDDPSGHDDDAPL